MIRLHGILPYDRSAKARWLMAELGVEHQDRWIDREKNEFESPEFLRLNPMGRIPVLEIDGRALFESGAICAYLADRYIDKGLAPALGSPERMEYQQWMYFAATTLDSFVNRMMIIEDIPAGSVRNLKESEFLAEVRDTIHTVDLALSKSSFLVADRLSAADICMSYQLYWCTLWPEMDVILKESPRVTAYLERLKSRPAAAKAKVFSYEG